MRLLHLDVSGFKSFPDPVSVDFAGGITAIVGPNGCGKSNLSEAMTWVLGEQSAKSLRGGSMADVIFNGSQQRKPLGMADATLVLEADPEMEQAEDGRISLSRRVFSSGEGQYRMNGKVVRLKDVKDFLMDTGLGIRAYSVIEQGKIGMILSGKPQERRKLLEEAAGITRYKQRKRLAEMKLEEATANLLRLDDVVSEVERSLRSLKRQASAARRYRRKQAEYRRLFRWVLLRRWSAVRDRLSGLEDRLVSAVDREAETTARLHRDDAALSEGRERLEDLAAELADRHQRRSDLAATIEGRQEYLKGARSTLQEIEERAAQGRATAERRQYDLTRWEEELERLAERRVELAQDFDSASSEVSRDEENIGAAERRLEEATARIETLRRRLLDQADVINRLRQQHQQAEIELEKGTYRQGHLDRELEEHLAELTQAQQAVEVAAGKVGELEERLEAKKAELQRVTEALETTVRREADAQKAQERAEEELSEARQRHRLLTELSRAHAERRARLVEALESAGLTEPVFLADRLSAVEGWERSLDFYLAELTDAVLLDSDADGQSLASALAEGSSRALLVRPLDAAPESFPVVDDDAVALSLGEALGLSDGLAAALPPAFLVDRPDDAERLAREHPGSAFLSRDGLWAEGGALHVEARETAPGVLERERELTELEEALPHHEETARRARRELEGLVERRAELARDKNRLEGEQAQLRQELAVAQAQHENARERHERLAEERRELTSEQQELADELTAARTARQELSGELETAEAEHSGLQETFDRAQEELDSAKAEREQLRTASADRRGRLELLRERLGSHDRETRRVEQELEEGRRQSAAWSDEADRLERRRAELEAGIAGAEKELQSALERRAASDDDVLEAQQRLDEHREALRELEARVNATREQQGELRSELEALRVERASLKQDAGHLVETFHEQFGEALPGGPSLSELQPEAEDEAEGPEAEGAEQVLQVADAKAMDAEAAEDETTSVDDEQGDLVDDELDDEARRRMAEARRQAAAALERDIRELEEEDWEPPAGLEEAENDLARLRTQIDRLGPVNVLAMEEYAEQEERHQFLIEQRADVRDSVESLRRTIREINETSSERFQETFARVNENFGETFQRLFRGGEAEMRLLDEEDVLESGIEILARPPGKRLQNIMLLSGGEKALTAIALLFALFRTKPSPFCILDEVDAPLDDVNTVRFVEMLQEMSEDTQFIIITHNKITMEVAGTLYGVTMEEKGVSKLVSVEVDDVQPAEEAGAA